MIKDLPGEVSGARMSPRSYAPKSPVSHYQSRPASPNITRFQRNPHRWVNFGSYLGLREAQSYGNDGGYHVLQADEKVRTTSPGEHPDEAPRPVWMIYSQVL